MIAIKSRANNRIKLQCNLSTRLKYNNFYSTDNRIIGNPTVPIVSPVSEEGSDNEYSRPEPGNDPNNENNVWEQDTDQMGEDEENQGGADPSLPWETNLRLPRSVIPVHYDLYLFPDLKTGMFSGKQL